MKAYSQYTEDGLLDEIFRRIGTTDQYFVEFGVGDGLENNTAYRLALGWQGLWLDANPGNMAAIRAGYASLIAAGRLAAAEARVSAANVEELFIRSGVPEEFDLLSIDIDGNDYRVWRAISAYRPRVVVVEYNSALGPAVRWAMPDGPEHAIDRERFFGGSLKEFEELGREKGYALIGCDLSGVNAFFVRLDLVGDRFLAPHDSETHFEPPRYYLLPFPGHPPSHKEVSAMAAGPPATAPAPAQGRPRPETTQEGLQP